MPRSRMDELFQIAEASDALLTSKQASDEVFQDSVLLRLAQRERQEKALGLAGGNR